MAKDSITKSDSSLPPRIATWLWTSDSPIRRVVPVSTTTERVLIESARPSTITNSIWSIADSIPRYVFERAKYREIILPVNLQRRLDAVPEPSKLGVLDMKPAFDHEKIADQDDDLAQQLLDHRARKDEAHFLH